MDDAKAQLLRWIDEDREEIVGFLCDFVRAKSPNPPGDTTLAATHVARFLEREQLPFRIIAPQVTMPNIVGSFEGARTRSDVVPLGESANGDRPFEPTARPGRGQAPRGPLRPRRGLEPAEGRGTGLAHELVDGGPQDEGVTCGEAVEQFRHEGLQAVGADLAGRLPPDGRGAADLGAVAAGAAPARIACRDARHPPQQSDDRLRCSFVMATISSSSARLSARWVSCR
jgi:hypothetical protein